MLPCLSVYSLIFHPSFFTCFYYVLLPWVLQSSSGIQQVPHLRIGELAVESCIGPLPVPSPLLLELRLELVLEHLHHVLAQHWEELVSVERAACRDVQTLGTCVRGDDEISTRCECVPVTCGVSRSFLVIMVGVLHTSRCGASRTSSAHPCFRRIDGWRCQCLPSGSWGPSIERSPSHLVVQRRHGQGALRGGC